ncbi:MAG: putative sulfate exporter family transporter [Pseudomonadota bacterium]
MQGDAPVPPKGPPKGPPKEPPKGPPAPPNWVRQQLAYARTLTGGVLLSVTVAAAAVFLAQHYGAPAMLFALLIGMAFNFLADDPKCAPGIGFAAKSVLRLGVALLGLRLSFSDLAALGIAPSAGLVGLVAMTILSGLVFARVFRRDWSFGILTGGAVAICGASAALAIASVLPKSKSLEQDTLFTVIGVTTLSTIAMVIYPILGSSLGLDDTAMGFLIGATIHDVAQVVGAGFSVSEAAGNTATLVKLQRVALLPVVLIVILLLTTRREGAGSLQLPHFLIAFVVLMTLNSLGIVPEALRDLAIDASGWMLVTAIAALGVKTSVQAMTALGPRHAAVVVCETLLLLGAGLLFAGWVFGAL